MNEKPDIQPSLEGLADLIIKEMKALIKINGSFASGELYNSFKKKVFKDASDTWHMKIDYVYYGLFVDKGTRPGHWPNIQSLREWARFKGIPQAAVGPIARKIFERGTKPRPFTTPFEEDSKIIKKVAQEMGEKFADDAAEQILRDAKYFKGRIR